ncbi:hypothetical protein IKQ21_07440 [bacterium]|nr:hypothetical protein [bacterium]
MAKIQKVELNLGQKIINPFKTSRNSTTNPFKYQDFEGNALDISVCADVFETASAKSSKLKLITSSVMGSMTKLRSSITEPIINFVKRIGTGISNAWDYAKNTNISEVRGFRTISEVLGKDVTDIGHDIKNSISDSVSGLGRNIHDKISSITPDLTGLGKGIFEKWSALIERVHHNKISKETTVSELKAMWENEIALAKEAA